MTPTVAAGHPELPVVDRAVADLLIENPDDADLLLRQAQLRTKAGNWDAALESLDHAREHGAEPSAVSSARAGVFLAAGLPYLAKYEYDRALAERPDAFEARFERGRVNLALGDSEAADRDFGEAIARMPEPRPEHFVIRKNALVAAGRIEEAVGALDEGVARLGHLASLELPAIELEIRLGRFDRALARLDGLLETTPTSVAWIARRAELLERTGRSEDARAARLGAIRQLEARQTRNPNRAGRELAERLRRELAMSGSKEGDTRETTSRTPSARTPHL